jgi:hypothetical protein
MTELLSLLHVFAALGNPMNHLLRCILEPYIPLFCFYFLIFLPFLFYLATLCFVLVVMILLVPVELLLCCA